MNAAPRSPGSVQRSHGHREVFILPGSAGSRILIWPAFGPSSREVPRHEGAGTAGFSKERVVVGRKLLSVNGFYAGGVSAADTVNTRALNADIAAINFYI